MDGFKDAVYKLEQLRDGGLIAADEFDRRKKELVDTYVGTAPAGGGAVGAYAPTGAVGVTGEESSTVVKLRGIPFTATDRDVTDFFAGFALDFSEPVRFQMNAEGKHSGICYVKFQSVEEAVRAQTKNRQYLGQRYVEVFPSSVDEMQQKTAPIGATNWVRMRGLPFSSTKADIKQFFEGFHLNDAGIFMVTGKGGRPSGEAFVQFSDENETQRALLKDKEPIGQRYIEMFLATREDCDAAIARHSREPMMGAGKGYGGGAYSGGYGAQAAYGGGGYGAQPAYGAQYGAVAGYGGGKGGGMGATAGVSTGGVDNVVRLRGLPFRSTEQDIVTFLAGLDIARSLIVYQGGRPSGEAFVEFRNRYGVEGALQRNRGMMGPRYVEVFESSAAEMDARSAGAMGGQQAAAAPYGQQAGYGVTAATTPFGAYGAY